MTAALLPDRVNLAQIGQLAWTGRAAVANWRKRYVDFPRPVGGTDISPLFERAAAEHWLREHGLLPQIAIPTPAERADARLTALQAVRVLMPGVLAGAFADSYEGEAPQEGRAAIALLRDWTKVADTFTEVLPLLLELGYLTASALATVNQFDRARVDAWLSARTDAADEQAGADPSRFGLRADATAAAIATIAAEVLWVVDRDALYEQHVARTGRRLWAESRVTGEEAQVRRFELVLSAGWLAAHVLAPALGGRPARIDAHLEALARHIIDRRTG
ncbi:hypothetical protein [Kitasatospora sp. NBC_01300]|uniref:hypothetical protein n=1 Tax=Kitasatospora sp. NBC_01300 TaxID=2903574 RepID=UPI002F910E82|nr:hypothetical protein OG556_39920 [Kitasatospora sp. NBC_01300]